MANSQDADLRAQAEKFLEQAAADIDSVNAIPFEERTAPTPEFTFRKFTFALAERMMASGVSPEDAVTRAGIAAFSKLQSVDPETYSDEAMIDRALKAREAAAAKKHLAASKRPSMWEEVKTEESEKPPELRAEGGEYLTRLTRGEGVVRGAVRAANIVQRKLDKPVRLAAFPLYWGAVVFPNMLFNRIPGFKIVPDQVVNDTLDTAHDIIRPVLPEADAMFSAMRANVRGGGRPQELSSDEAAKVGSTAARMNATGVQALTPIERQRLVDLGIIESTPGVESPAP